METTFTLRDSPYKYLQLQITTNTPRRTTDAEVDEITVKSHLNSALNQYLGLTGSAIDLDILKVDGNAAWIRLPGDDETAVVAALSQWVGQGGVAVRVKGRSGWLGTLAARGDDEKLWSLEP